MLGSQENPGIISCSLQHIFDHCQQDHSREYSLRISMLEIYNETITDLLYPENGNLKIHESISVTFAGSLWVPNPQLSVESL